MSQASKSMESVKVRHKKTLTELKSTAGKYSMEEVQERRTKTSGRQKQVKIEIEAMRREIEAVGERVT